MSESTSFDPTDHPRDDVGQFAAKDSPESEATLEADTPEQRVREHLGVSSLAGTGDDMIAMEDLGEVLGYGPDNLPDSGAVDDALEAVSAADKDYKEAVKHERAMEVAVARGSGRSQGSGAGRRRRGLLSLGRSLRRRGRDVVSEGGRLLDEARQRTAAAEKALEDARLRWAAASGAWLHQLGRDVMVTPDHLEVDGVEIPNRPGLCLDEKVMTQLGFVSDGDGGWYRGAYAE